MIFICVRNDDPKVVNITIGKLYNIVLSIDEFGAYGYDDNMHHIYFIDYRLYFEPITDWREKQINKLLDEI